MKGIHNRSLFFTNNIINFIQTGKRPRKRTSSGHPQGANEQSKSNRSFQPRRAELQRALHIRDVRQPPAHTHVCGGDAAAGGGEGPGSA